MKNMFPGRKCFVKVSSIFDSSECAKIYGNIFEVYDGFIGKKILKL